MYRWTNGNTGCFIFEGEFLIREGSKLSGMLELTTSRLHQVLLEANKAHHDYQLVTLNGVKDPLWASFYTAYLLGKLNDFVLASELNQWLESIPMDENWYENAAIHILENYNNEQRSLNIG